MQRRNFLSWLASVGGVCFFQIAKLAAAFPPPPPLTSGPPANVSVTITGAGMFNGTFLLPYIGDGTSNHVWSRVFRAGTESFVVAVRAGTSWQRTSWLMVTADTAVPRGEWSGSSDLNSASWDVTCTSSRPGSARVQAA